MPLEWSALTDGMVWDLWGSDEAEKDVDGLMDGRARLDRAPDLKKRGGLPGHGGFSIPGHGRYAREDSIRSHSPTNGGVLIRGDQVVVCGLGDRRDSGQWWS